MKHALIVLLPALLAAPLCAQEVELKAAKQQQPQQFLITTKLQTSDSRKMLINGEEPGAGGGRGGRGGFGGGGGENSMSQQIEFVEGPGGAWREYGKLNAVQSRPGRDGEARETSVVGALQGKKVFLKSAADGSVTLSDGEGDKAKALDAALSRGVPAKVSLAGFLPGKAVAVGKSFQLDGFADALRGLMHPVTPERNQDAGGGRGQGGRAARGQGGRFGMGASNPVIDLIGAGKLKAEAEGKLIGVEEKDGHKIASIGIKARLSGKGKSADFGLRAGARGGRGGRGGQGADSGTDNLDAGYDIQGKVLFDVDQQRVLSVELVCEMKLDRKTERSMQNRDGEDQSFESTTNTTGKLELQARCTQAAK